MHLKNQKVLESTSHFSQVLVIEAAPVMEHFISAGMYQIFSKKLNKHFP